jgi:acyl transferase domain-containing protein/SAM-dependent methyltransferase
VSGRAGRPTLTGLDIAVVGLAGRFPGAKDIGRFWDNIRGGVESITRFSDEELMASGVRSTQLADPNYVRAAGVLEEVELFDAHFFGYSAREAALMDPQQRLFLETAWTALEHAGCDPARFPGVVGVYAGSGLNSYLLRHVLPSLPGQAELDYQAVLTNDKDFLCTRASYKLDLQGPSVVVQTACSTSLVAVHLACQALAGGECDLALAGGVSIRLPQKAGYLFQEEGILSPDGRCRAFDARARGCVPGSGVAVVALRRLPDALREGDLVHAVIRGTAINNDGSSKMGYTAPRAEGQSQVIRSALSVAEVSADTIGYVEAHGTGTVLGDPIEVQGLIRAFEPDTRRRGFCALGSVKTNLGHLDVAAGVTGLIKAVLTVRDGLLAPSLHFETPNPQIDFVASPFYVNTQLREWPGGAPRRAGVSSFGIGGTNAHVVVEEPPSRAAEEAGRRPEIVVLSAKTEAALREASANLADHLRSHRKVELGDVAFTLQAGRAAFACRRSVVGTEAAEVASALEAPPSPKTGRVMDPRPEVAFLFPGQGSQLPGMGEGLYRTRPQFRREVDVASDILRPRLGVDLRDLLFSAATNQAGLSNTRLAQAAIFTVSHALARLWMSFGVRPMAMLGHSVGEYVAACLAGVLSLEDALALVAERGRLMSGVAGGAMLAVPLAAEEVEPRLGGRLALAAVNGPGQSVVAGTNEAVEALESTLRQQGVESRRLRTSHAFHSSMMDPILGPFTEVVEKVPRGSPQIPYLSNVTGRWVTDEDLADPSYWARHLRQTVRFSAGLERLLERPNCVFLEVGPGHTLTSLVRRHRSAGRVPLAIASLPSAPGKNAEEASLLKAVGDLWMAGVTPDWSVAGAQGRHRVALPTYPFERRRHWLDPKRPLEAASPSPEGERRPVFQALSWQRLMAPPQRHGRREALVILADGYGFGAALADRLKEEGRSVTTVSAGSAFRRVGESCYEIDPRCRDDHDALFAALDPDGQEPLHIVHCLTVEPDSEVRTDLGGLEYNEGLAFFSLLFAVQGLGARQQQTPCRLTVVTSQVHEVTGEETLCPAKAAVLGPCLVAPLEYPGFECRQIDIIPPVAGAGPTRRLLDRLVDALALGPDPAVMALRGSHLWHRTSAPLTLDPGSTPPLRRRGVYLVTGGLGGIGLALAEDLARTVEARLVLVGRTALPPRGEWDAWLDARAQIDFGRVVTRLSHLEEESVSHSPQSSITRSPGLPADLDRLSSSHVLDLLAEAGIDTAREWRLAELREAMGITPGFSRFFEAMLRMIAEDGFASLDEGTTLRFPGRPREWPDTEALRRTATARHPSFVPVLELLHHCARHHLRALRGEIPALDVLYGEPGGRLFRAATKTILAHSSLLAQQELVRELLAGLVGEERGRALRILEVGGGEGILTRALVPALAGHDVEYHFTDIGRSFVVSAESEARARGHRFMHFGVLDIARPAEEQGYGRGGFDVVLAFNVVHATPSVRDSLDHLRELLAPGGMLMLHESVKPRRWVDLVWGLTEEWWAFEDTSLRRRSPLLDLDRWIRVLAEQGFEGITAVPHDPGRRTETDAAVVLAQRPAVSSEELESETAGLAVEPFATRSKIRKIRELEAEGTEVQVIAADVADREQMCEALARLRERFGRVDGVIHGALVLNDGAMQLKTREAAASVLAPKVRGTLVLKELLQDADLDFFVLLSSLVSIWGGKGQVDYCAASNVQDAFAYAEQGRLARVVLSINWPAWREVGRAVREAIRRGERPEAARRDGLLTRQGVEAFRLALGSSLSQVLVMPPGGQATGREGSASPATAGAVLPAVVPRPEIVAPPGAEGPRSEPERIMAEIWRDLLGVDSVSVHDSFFELGGDSVTSLQFVARAKKAGLRFTNRQVFERQTIADLAALATKTRDRDEGAAG